MSELICCAIWAISSFGCPRDEPLSANWPGDALTGVMMGVEAANGLRNCIASWAAWAAVALLTVVAILLSMRTLSFRFTSERSFCMLLIESSQRTRRSKSSLTTRDDFRLRSKCASGSMTPKSLCEPVEDVGDEDMFSVTTEDPVEPVVVENEDAPWIGRPRATGVSCRRTGWADSGWGLGDECTER